jgi:hypothetical protein
VEYTSQYLFQYLRELLTQKIQDTYPHQGLLQSNDPLDLGVFMYVADLGNLTLDLAEAVTAQIRTNTGDNPGATLLAGDSYGGRYLWRRSLHPSAMAVVDFPLAETLLTVVLLVISIILKRRQPLLKTSVIAFLVHSLDGWKDENLDIKDPETGEELERLADGMVARLARDK